MTQFLSSQIPVSIINIEQLSVWCVEILKKLYSAHEYLFWLTEDGDQVIEKVIQSGVYRSPATKNSSEYFYTSGVSLKLSNNRHFGVPWDYVIELGQLPIPKDMKNTSNSLVKTTKQMTQFLSNQIPATITTVEQLAVWCMEILQYLYPNDLTIEFLDEAGEPIDRRSVEAGIFFYTAPFPPEWRHSSRFTIAVSDNYKKTGHIWDHVDILGNLPIPAEMKKAV